MKKDLFLSYKNGQSLTKEDFKNFNFFDYLDIYENSFLDFLWIYAFEKQYIEIVNYKILFNYIFTPILDCYSLNRTKRWNYSELAYQTLKGDLIHPVLSFLSYCSFTEQEEKDFLLNHIDDINKKERVAIFLSYKENIEFVESDAFKFMVGVL